MEIGIVHIGKDSVASSADTLGQSDHTVCASPTACLRTLPVALLDFTGRRINPAQVALQWATATEQNNKGFKLERTYSRSGQFTAIAFIPGRSNSNTLTTYHYDDANAFPGITYYRLQQLDIDGRSSYSKIIAVAGTQEPLHLMLYPNPANDHAIVSVNSAGPQVMTLKLYNHLGVEMWRKDQTINNIGNIRIPLQQLPGGIYTLKITSGNTHQQALKLIKQ